MLLSGLSFKILVDKLKLSCHGITFMMSESPKVAEFCHVMIKFDEE